MNDYDATTGSAWPSWCEQGESTPAELLDAALAPRRRVATRC